MGDNVGWPWPESLDAVVAAPEHHAVLLENERVRVLEARVERNDIVPVHTHRWPGVQYILSFADFVRRDTAGEVLIDSRGMDMLREKGHSCCGPSRFLRTRSRTSETASSMRS
jgi:hypothetical protein